MTISALKRHIRSNFARLLGVRYEAVTASYHSPTETWQVVAGGTTWRMAIGTDDDAMSFTPADTSRARVTFDLPDGVA